MYLGNANVFLATDLISVCLEEIHCDMSGSTMYQAGTCDWANTSRSEFCALCGDNHLNMELTFGKAARYYLTCSLLATTRG